MEASSSIKVEGNTNMSYGPLYAPEYRPKFSGHETFPFRYGWLKKVFDRVVEKEKEGDNKKKCWGEDAIACFGVGKNMVSAMRHWASMVGIIKDSSSGDLVEVTQLGRRLLDDKGLDPYLENPASLWLIHWQLASKKKLTTWFWAFNNFPGLTFERDDFIREISELVKDRSWLSVSGQTIKNDVSCFIRTYSTKQFTEKVLSDDTLESPLTELGLIQSVGKDGFRFVRGYKKHISIGVFVFALLDFWENYSPGSSTLSFEAIAHAPGSPGKVFLFDENDIADLLARLEKSTEGKFSWSETSGMKQIVRNVETSEDIRINLLDTYMETF